MTLYTDRKPREAVARAIMVADGCGLTHEDEHVFCDDKRLPDHVRSKVGCGCRREADAVLNLIRLNGWHSQSLLDAIHAEEDANGEPRSSVVPGSGR